MASNNAGDIGGAKEEVPKKASVVDEFDDDVSDPDEDDLDDLDDMLDEFAAVDLQAKQPSGPAGPAAAGAGDDATGEDDVLSEEEFAKQLQAGMADLLGGIDNSPELQAQFESIFKELSAAAAASGAETPGIPTPKAETSTKTPPSFSRRASASASPSSKNAAEASFQETIRRTMERMQTSGEQATAAAAAEGSDDFLAELLKQMQSGGLEGEGSEEEFSKMLMGMMEQLTHKDILYEPMKELHEKFPGWLEKNRATTSKEDLERYELQQKLVSEIVAKFEEPNYADTSKEHHEYIVDRMQKMQDAGQPPNDLVGDMPSAQNLDLPDDQCPTQ
ncbi:Pex19 protein family-domain-containing protein [Pseudoneurospora amorphoporcata]|uniref:Pex19 protein family-domain-containing protein n=1 Tax=Pseudoneurospora amorphoporcata TaxID=241081 RepID=A0AAN6SKJ8_9PEZI|nr:Pex19 protein family-domain-containing protein [Pseudoneurospora amorphoporcata]